MWAVGRLVREESQSVFTRRGVVGHDIRNAAQAACIPVGHIVKEIAGVFGPAGFEDFLLSAHGEPLGAPVRSILKEARPLIGLFASVAVDKMGAQDRGGLRRAFLQSSLGEGVGALVAFDAAMARGEAYVEFTVAVGREPVVEQMVDPDDGHLAGFDVKVEDGVSSGFVIAEQVSASSIGARDDLDGFFYSPYFRVE